MKKIILLLLVSIMGCASTGVVPTGPDSYFVARDGGFLGSMKANNIQDASTYCVKVGKEVQITATQDMPGGFGRAAHSEVQFMCLDKGDSRLKGGPLVPTLPQQAK